MLDQFVKLPFRSKDVGTFEFPGRRVVGAVGGEVQADVDEDHHRAARRQQQHEEADELAPALGPGTYVINILPP